MQERALAPLPEAIPTDDVRRLGHHPRALALKTSDPGYLAGGAALTAFFPGSAGVAAAPGQYHYVCRPIAPPAAELDWDMLPSPKRRGKFA